MQDGRCCQLAHLLCPDVCLCELPALAVILVFQLHGVGLLLFFLFGLHPAEPLCHGLHLLLSQLPLHAENVRICDVQATVTDLSHASLRETMALMTQLSLYCMITYINALAIQAQARCAALHQHS